MSPRSRRPFACALVTVAAVVTLAAAPDALHAASKAVERPRLLSRLELTATERAKAGAARRLASAECQKLLADYSDSHGTRLSENLAPWGLSASEYVRQLPFFDGAGVPSCRRESVRLATVPGTVQVFVCPGGPGRLNSLFSTIEAENPSLAEVMVIHEMLHTLGLGENPPTPQAITAQVRLRCGEAR